MYEVAKAGKRIPSRKELREFMACVNINLSDHTQML